MSSYYPSSCEHCNYLERQLEVLQSDQLKFAKLELPKQLSVVNKQLLESERHIEHCNDTYQKIENDLKMTTSQLEKVQLKSQDVIKENRSLQVNVSDLNDQLISLRLDHERLIEKNKSLKVDLAELLEQLRSLRLEHHDLIEENKLLKVNLADLNCLYPENRNLLTENCCELESNNVMVQHNDHDSISDLNVDVSSGRLDEELQDSIERDKTYEKWVEILNEREKRCEEREQTLAEQEKRCNERETRLLKQEESWDERDRTQRDQPIIINENEVTRPILPVKRKSIPTISERAKRSRTVKRPSWQIEAAEFLKEELISAWSLNPWSFWSPGEGNYKNCIKVTLTNRGPKNSHLQRMRLMVARLWLVWERNRRAELGKFNATSVGIGFQIKRTLENVDLRYTLHMSFAPQAR